jgi:hypothetical protein
MSSIAAADVVAGSIQGHRRIRFRSAAEHDVGIRQDLPHIQSVRESQIAERHVEIALQQTGIAEGDVQSQ